MKRHVAIILLTLLLILSVGILSACGNNNNSGDNPPAPTICEYCEGELGDDSAHQRCDICQIHKCLGTHSACKVSSWATQHTSLTVGEYKLDGYYDGVSIDCDKYLSIRCNWRWVLNVNSNGECKLTFSIKSGDNYIDFASIEGRLENKGGEFEFIPTVATAFLLSLNNPNAINQEVTCNDTTSMLKTYSNNTFTGVINLPFSICGSCFGIKEVGNHSTCSHCGQKECNGSDHSIGACGEHYNCATQGGDHSLCALCNDYRCNGEDHTLKECGDHAPCTNNETDLCDVLCEYCDKFKCDGLNHTLAPCGVHHNCEEGNHTRCDYCSAYVCAGGEHGSAPCGRHKVCDGSITDLCGVRCQHCGGYKCSGDHDAVCQYCNQHVCKGGDHTIAPCGEHARCEEGNHNLCSQCGEYQCAGGVHGYAPCGVHSICRGENTDLCSVRCEHCNKFKCVGDHDSICEYCDRHICVDADHTLAECGVHGKCESGTHSVCSHCDEYICAGGEHGFAPCGTHVICQDEVSELCSQSCVYCRGYKCDGKDHASKAPCNNHRVCEDGDHTLCSNCNGYLCMGGDRHTTTASCGIHTNCVVADHGICSFCGGHKCDDKEHTLAPCRIHGLCDGNTHEVCKYCNQYACQGDHSECKPFYCDGCGVQDVQHAKCYYCQQYVCKGDHSGCVPSGSKKTSNFVGEYESSGHTHITETYYYNGQQCGSATIDFDWAIRLNINADNTWTFEFQMGELVTCKMQGTWRVVGTQVELTPLSGSKANIHINGNTGETTITYLEMAIDSNNKILIDLYTSGQVMGDFYGMMGVCSGCTQVIKAEEADEHTKCNLCHAWLCKGGDHTHGGQICATCGQSDVEGDHSICEHCSRGVCDGKNHNALADCSDHYKCESGSHGVCSYCAEKMCNGKVHGACSACGTTVACTSGGRHNKCEYVNEGGVQCTGYLCDGQDHFHGGFNCFDHVPTQDDGDCTTPILCTLCNRVIEEGEDSHILGSHLHTDSTHHWYDCQRQGCTAKADCEEHILPNPTCMGDQTCTTCGYLKEHTEHVFKLNSSKYYVCDICSGYAPHHSSYKTQDSYNDIYYYGLEVTTQFPTYGHLTFDINEYLREGEEYAPGAIQYFKSNYATSIYISADTVIGYGGYVHDNFSTWDVPLLEKIVIAEDNPNYTVIDNVIYNKDVTKLLFVPAGYKNDTLTIPATVTAIGDYAIPANSNIKKIVINGTECITLEEGILGNFANLEMVDLTNVSLSANAFSGCTLLKSLTFDNCTFATDSVTGLSDVKNIQFINCTTFEMDSIRQISGVEEISFINCNIPTGSPMKYITDVNKVTYNNTTIEKYVLHECSSVNVYLIGSVTLDSGFDCTGNLYVESIEQCATAGNPYKTLHNLYVNGVLQESVVYTDEAKQAFKYTTIKSVVIAEGTQRIYNQAFYKCDNLESVQFPQNAITIGGKAFGYCEKLTEIRCYNQVTLYENAFVESGVKVIDIPYSWTLPATSFILSRTWQLEELTLSLDQYDDYRDSCVTIRHLFSDPDWEKTEDSDTYYSVEWQYVNPSNGATLTDYALIPKALKTINLTGVDTITEQMFSYLKDITININSDVQAIEALAFANCSNVTINFDGTKEQWQAITKASDWASKSSYTINYLQ